MKELFVLDSFWPVCKLCQFLGLFPYKKVSDTTNGTIKLKPLHGCLYFTTFCLVYGIFWANFFGSMYYIANIAKVSMVDALFVFFGFTLNKTTTDKLTYATAITLIYVHQIIILSYNWKLRKKLCEFQDFILKHMEVTPAHYRSLICHITWKYYIIIIGNLMMVCIMPIGNVFHTLDYRGINQRYAKLPLQAAFFFHCICLLPTFVFLAIFTGISCKLIAWSAALKEQLIMDDNPSGVLNACHNLHLGLCMASKTMTAPIYYTINIYLFCLICNFYRITSFFIGQNETNWPIQIVIGGFSSYGLIISGIVIFLNLVSQEVQDKVRELRKALENSLFDENEMISIDDQKQQNAKERRNVLVKHLEEFQGFDGYGYFHLSKSLLTSIITNFMTYLIILIQFKVSEISLH